MYSGMAFSFLLRTVQSWIVRINTSQKQIIQFFLWDLWLQPKKHRTSPKHLGYSSVSRHQGVKRCIFWSADNVETHEALLPGETAQVLSISSDWHCEPLTRALSIQSLMYCLTLHVVEFHFFDQLPQLFSGEFPIFFLQPPDSCYEHILNILTPNLCQVNSN